MPVSMEAPTRPLVSVCIANFNGIDVIEACISSVLEQVGAPEVEIIVHDDASTDGSADLVAEHYPQVRLVRSTNNVGFCVSNNRMVAQAQGEYLLLLNNDATLLPDALATLLRSAIAIERPAILGLPQYDAQTGQLIDMGCLLDPFVNPVPNLDPERHDVGMVIGACLWIPKLLWDELDGFPEWFESIGEDLYLCCRARLAGYPVRALGSSGYWHRVGASFGGGKVTEDAKLVTTYRRRALSERNKSFVMIACYPLPLILLFLPLHAALLLAEGVLLSLLRQAFRPLSEIYVPALSACWRHRACLKALRLEVQAQRHSSLVDFLAPVRVVPWKLVALLRHGIPRLT